MEQMSCEIRDREKNRRELKKRNTVVLQGYQLYSNYVRSPYMALDGKTLAEM
jgi:putative transposase